MTRPPSLLRAIKRLHELPDLRTVAARRAQIRCWWTWPFGHCWGDVRYVNGVKRHCLACGAERDDSWDAVY